MLITPKEKNLSTPDEDSPLSVLISSDAKPGMAALILVASHPQLRGGSDWRRRPSPGPGDGRHPGTGPSTTAACPPKEPQWGSTPIFQQPDWSVALLRLAWSSKSQMRFWLPRQRPARRGLRSFEMGIKRSRKIRVFPAFFCFSSTRFCLSHSNQLNSFLLVSLLCCNAAATTCIELC